nr:uncharacterized protein LOC115260406 [Aedes albopictus]
MSGDESKKDVSHVENGGAMQQQQQNGGMMEKVHIQSGPGDLKQIVLDGLEKKGDRGLWLWVLFILCLTPNILNGFHVSSYVFLGQMPANYYCTVPSLVERGWTHEEIRTFPSLEKVSEILKRSPLDFSR